MTVYSKNTGVVCHPVLQWNMFCQNSALSPLCLEWPCKTCLIASLGYASPFTTTRLWSMKGVHSRLNSCQYMYEWRQSGPTGHISKLWFVYELYFVVGIWKCSQQFLGDFTVLKIHHKFVFSTAIKFFSASCLELHFYSFGTYLLDAVLHTEKYKFM